jgi:hypothetical protein
VLIGENELLSGERVINKRTRTVKRVCLQLHNDLLQHSKPFDRKLIKMISLNKLHYTNIQ